MTDNFHFHGILEPYLSRIILMCRYTCYYHSIIVQYLVDMVNLSIHIKNWLGDDIIVIIRVKKIILPQYSQAKQARWVSRECILDEWKLRDSAMSVLKPQPGHMRWHVMKDCQACPHVTRCDTLLCTAGPCHAVDSWRVTPRVVSCSLVPSSKFEMKVCRSSGVRTNKVQSCSELECQK